MTLLPLRNATLATFPTQAKLAEYLGFNPEVQFICKCQRQKSRSGEVHALLVTHPTPQAALRARLLDEINETEARKKYALEYNQKKKTQSS